MHTLMWRTVGCLGLGIGLTIFTGEGRRIHGAEPAAGKKAVPVDASMGSGGPGGGVVKSFLKVGLRKREFRLFVPQSVNPAKPAPLVFAFHGRGDTPEAMSKYTELDKLAEKYGFVLIYPTGARKVWHIMADTAENDLDFFDELYDKITKDYNIDLNRVYAVGMSNGAFFVNLLASERPNRVAAIVSHSGGIGLVGQNERKLPRKYAVMLVHGADDDVIKVEVSRESRDIYQKWGHAVEYLELPNRGHEWGLKDGVNEKAWKFLSEHPLQQR